MVLCPQHEVPDTSIRRQSRRRASHQADRPLPSTYARTVEPLHKVSHAFPVFGHRDGNADHRCRNDGDTTFHCFSWHRHCRSPTRNYRRQRVVHRSHSICQGPYRHGDSILQWLGYCRGKSVVLAGPWHTENRLPGLAAKGNCPPLSRAVAATRYTLAVRADLLRGIETLEC